MKKTRRSTYPFQEYRTPQTYPTKGEVFEAVTKQDPSGAIPRKMQNHTLSKTLLMLGLKWESSLLRKK